MGKRRRGKFERDPKDFYRTPWTAALPLLDHLPPGTRYLEPCAGEGDLIGHLNAAGHILVSASDSEIDATKARYDVPPGAQFITNSPWRVDVLHPLIENLSDQAPTWLLLYSDWIHTQQAGPYLPRLRAIIAVGRVRWIAGTKKNGFDNASWHLFDRPAEDCRCLIEFIGLKKRPRIRAPRTALIEPPQELTGEALIRWLDL